ncbi:MAG TPA: head maturation protease, ClpP-related, partial [Actinomycetota bacterium]|nr:head maturation protease, ClpP-related [Actinomycetota bacterium]
MNRDSIRARLRAHLTPKTTEGEPWYRIKNAAGAGGEPAEVYIYDEIGWLGHTAADLMSELKAITAPEITLRINSPGGEIFDGIAIYSQLRNHPARVTVQVDSLAASIASVIAMAGDRIVMQPFSQMMIHDGSGMCIGDAADMLDMAELLGRQSDNIAAIYNERAGGGAKTWRQRMKAETWYTAEEAVAAGLADEVAKPTRQAEPDRMAARWDLSVFRHAGREAAPAPELVNAAETVGQALASEDHRLPGDLAEGYTGAKDESAAGTPPQDDLEQCPDCDQLVAESAMAEHRKTQHAEADRWAAVFALAPPTGSLVKLALEQGVRDPLEYDPEELRATLRTLVNETPAVEIAEEDDTHVVAGPGKCPECGAALPDTEGVVECPECGARVTTDSPEEEGTPADVVRETLATIAEQAPAQ